MTKVEKLQNLLSNHPEFTPEEVDLINGVIKAASKPRKPSKEQVANDEMRTAIVDMLANSPQAMAVGDIAAAFDVSVNKVGALLRDPVNEERVYKFKKAKTVFYALVRA